MKAFDRVWYEALWATMRKYSNNASIMMEIGPQKANIMINNPNGFEREIKPGRGEGLQISGKSNL